jgi:adenylate kinase
MFNIFKKQVLEKVPGGGNKPRAFIFIGRSGCGKGTQADLLMTHLCKIGDKTCKTFHIETGAFLREFVKGDTYTQKLCRTAMSEGKLMPEAIMVDLWQNFLTDNFTGTENLVFDGCPRKLHEAQLLDSAMRFYNIEKPNIVYVNVSHDWSEKRLIGRARKDDTPEAIERRLAWFEAEVMPTINYYRTNPQYNFIDINGEQPIEDVQNEILAKLGLNL